MLRFIHTADWHLGHTLHGVSRDYEHALFLDWLVETLETEGADALLVAGDVFDSANPPAAAQALLFRFLSEAKRRRPQLCIVLVAGNHDSASRLAAPAPILDGLGIHVVGGLPLDPEGEPDWERLTVPLRDARGEVAAWVGAMPFLRAADLPRGADGVAGDGLVDGFAARYAGLAAHLRAVSGSRGALVLTGHCYMRGGRLSEWSERKVLGGNQHALPASVFPEDAAYGALGHLHLAQTVGGAEHLRYSGSPIPLALDEAGYPHQVLRVDLAAGALAAVQPLLVPRTVPILQVPAEGAAPLDQVLAALERLDLDCAVPVQGHPFLEVRVLLDRPQPALRQRLDEALAGRPVRLLKVTAVYAGRGDPLAASVAAHRLDALAPEQVFLARYRSLHEGDPEPALLAAFHELLEGVQVGD